MNIVIGIINLITALACFKWSHDAETDKRWVSAVFYIVAAIANIYWAFYEFS